MGAKAGFALKFLQWIIRGIQFLCAALILGVYAYFLAALHNHDIGSSDSVRAVTGIAGAAALYTLIALLLLCCIAGLTFTSFLAIVLDVAFIGAFIYVAVANRNGAGSCDGYVDTPFGRGRAQDTAQGNSGGFTALPSYRTACRLQTACFSVAIIAIVFFLLSILMEVALARHHRKEKRFGPSPHNNYTSGAGDRPTRGGFFSRFRRNRTEKSTYDDHLPEHAHPNQVDGRQSYATEATAVNPDNRYSGNYKPDALPAQTGTTNTYGNFNNTTNTTGTTGTTNGYSHHTAGTVPPLAPQSVGNYRYGDGVYDQR